jgi:hypothetical protein
MNVIAVVNSNGTLDLTCKQGKTLTWSWTLYTDVLKTLPMNLTGYSARGQVRKRHSDKVVKANWECSIPLPVTGTVQISMSSEVSASIPAGESPSDVLSLYVYEIEIYSGVSPNEVVVSSIKGKYFNDPEVTKPNV